MAIPTGNEQTSGMGNLTISLPGCVSIKPGNTDPAEMEWEGTGGIVAFAGSDAPKGWLLCNGAAVDRDEYARLFKVIGTTYGVGNGNTTFHLPDLRGRAPFGVDAMGGAASGRLGANNQLGQSGGDDETTLTAAQLPAHNHAVLMGRQSSAGSNPFENRRIDNSNDFPTIVTARQQISGQFEWGGNGNFGRYERWTRRNGLVWNEDDTGGLGNTSIPLVTGGGGNGAHNNMPPYLSLNYIIKT